MARDRPPSGWRQRRLRATWMVTSAVLLNWKLSLGFEQLFILAFIFPPHLKFYLLLPHQSPVFRTSLARCTSGRWSTASWWAGRRRRTRTLWCAVTRLATASAVHTRRPSRWTTSSATSLSRTSVRTVAPFLFFTCFFLYRCVHILVPKIVTRKDQILMIHVSNHFRTKC